MSDVCSLPVAHACRCQQEQVKLEDEFDFETTIFPDRFMQRIPQSHVV